jgi:hypothetical protein
MQMPGCSNNTASDPSRNGSSSFSIKHPILSPLLFLDHFRLRLLLLSLPARHSTRLCHRGVLLLEPLAEPLGALEELVDAAHDAALLLGEERLGSEVGDAVGEAALDEVGVHLRSEKQDVSCCPGVSMVLFPGMGIASTYVHEVLHLLALHAALQLALLGGVQSIARIVSVKSFGYLCILRPLPLEQSTPGVDSKGSVDGGTYESIPLMLGM